jgi:NADH:ubiquinone oxidoreductase subunit H
LAEAESELVSGFMTEHAAVIFVFFFLAEYSSIVVICILTSILFLGGYLLDLTPLLYIYSIVQSIFEISVLSIMYAMNSILELFITVDLSNYFNFSTKGDILLSIKSIVANFPETESVIVPNLIVGNISSGIISALILGIKASAMIFVFI